MAVKLLSQLQLEVGAGWPQDFQLSEISPAIALVLDDVSPLGWSEFTFFWKLQKARAVSGPRHSTDFRTIDEIIIG